MKINRVNALQIWQNCFADNEYATDFHGNLMCRSAYGDSNHYIVTGGNKVYCGWNIHHVLPKTHGGTNASDNLICTNILTNEQAADKTTYWIDDSLYQVRKISGAHEYEIVRIA